MSSGADGRRLRGIASRAAILDAAERLFSEAGFHSTSVRAIAAAAGMSHAGVLKHFPSKGELLLAVLQKLESGNAMFAVDLSPELTAAERVRMLAEHTITQKVAVQLRVVLLGEAVEVEHPAHAFVSNQLDLVERDLTAGLGVDGVDLLALWNGLQLMWMYLPDVEPASIAGSYYEGSAPTSPDRPRAVTSATLRHDRAGAAVEREQQIVEAAADAFARSGYRATGLREIAAGLGLSHGTVLYHFPTKVRLLAAVLEDRDRGASLPWSWEETPLDYLNGLYLQALHDEQHPELGRLFSTLVCEATDPVHPAFEYFRSRYVRFHAELRGALADLVEQGVARDDIDPDAEAYALIALWEGLALRKLYRDDSTGLPERLRTRIDSLLKVTLNHASITTG